MNSLFDLSIFFSNDYNFTEGLIFKQLETQNNLKDDKEKVIIKLNAPVRKKRHSWHMNLAHFRKYHEQISSVLHRDSKYKYLRLSLLSSEEINQLEEFLVIFDRLSATAQQIV